MGYTAQAKLGFTFRQVPALLLGATWWLVNHYRGTHILVLHYSAAPGLLIVLVLFLNIDVVLVVEGPPLFGLFKGAAAHHWGFMWSTTKQT